MGLRSPPEDRREVPLYYSNPDIIYANEFPAPRFGQGCFAAALDAVYTAVCALLVKCHACCYIYYISVIAAFTTARHVPRMALSLLLCRKRCAKVLAF